MTSSPDAPRRRSCRDRLGGAAVTVIRSPGQPSHGRSMCRAIASRRRGTPAIKAILVLPPSRVATPRRAPRAIVVRNPCPGFTAPCPRQADITVRWWYRRRKLHKISRCSRALRGEPSHGLRLVTENVGTPTRVAAKVSELQDLNRRIAAEHGDADVVLRRQREQPRQRLACLRPEHGRPTPDVEDEPAVRRPRPKHVCAEVVRHLTGVLRPLFGARPGATRPGRSPILGGDDGFRLGRSRRGHTATLISAAEVLR
jgi:hypothetical protein